MIELFLKMMEFDFGTAYLCITPVKEYSTYTHNSFQDSRARIRALHVCLLIKMFCKSALTCLLV